jgi:hypothetical protein
MDTAENLLGRVRALAFGNASRASDALDEIQRLVKES